MVKTKDFKILITNLSKKYLTVLKPIRKLLNNQVKNLKNCEQSSHFLLPKEPRNRMTGLINIQNLNNECFKWCLVICLNPLNKNPAKIRNGDKEFPSNLILKA